AARAPETAGEPSASIQPVVPPGEPGQDAWGAVRRDRMSKIRKTIAAQMVRSAATAVHLTNFDDADITELEQLRKGVPKGWLGANVKLTTMPFVMKAVAIALRRHPMLNASLDEAAEQIIYKEYVHLGVAVDTARGLVVPVVRNVDRMTIPEIARALGSVAERARAVQFALEELRGGSFTVSNMGAVGGTYSTPIINYPEVAVLLLGRSRWLPVVRDNGARIEPRLMLPLSLSYDHRLVDGATAARFLNDVIDYLQTPGKLLLAE
ncbi:MAG: 2-oxo acid dehydrogenase subunit E2, partial [Pirellulales bacterium]|nr:2-oxo acid dehydrogenase subunit E2 [Pirellulales bacterium]